MTIEAIEQTLESAILASNEPLAVRRLSALFDEAERPDVKTIRKALDSIAKRYEEHTALTLKEVASGFTFQIKGDHAPTLKKLWLEKPPRYSRAVMETLALIAYRQPITRAEIEEVRGVTVSSHIVKTLIEREWVKEVGHREVPGRPVLLGTTPSFLDYFNLKSLSELPTLEEIKDLNQTNLPLELQEQEKRGQVGREKEEGSEVIAVEEVSEDVAEVELENM